MQVVTVAGSWEVKHSRQMLQLSSKTSSSPPAAGAEEDEAVKLVGFSREDGKAKFAMGARLVLHSKGKRQREREREMGREEWGGVRREGCGAGEGKNPRNAERERN